MAEFFDVGQSRSLPWKRRPEAARLLSTLANADRGFDAVVIGEPQRAFNGNQSRLHLPGCLVTTALGCGCRRWVERWTPVPRLTTS